jgi:hypothetical protein
MIVLSIHAPIEDKTDDMKDSFNDKLECVFNKFPKYHMKILLDFIAKVGREDICKPTIWNESLKKFVMIMELSSNFATSKNLTVIMFPHCNIHKFISTSLDGKTIKFTIFSLTGDSIRVYF